MRASLFAMAAMVAGTYAQPTCPVAATTTVFVTVDSSNNPGPSIIVQTVTATVLPPAQSPWSPAQPAQPSLPATLTVTIDRYDPPPGGSQFTGPKPWESSSATAAPVTVVTATVYSPGSANPNGGSPGSPASSGNYVPGSQETATVTLSGPPGFPWNPSQSATTDCPFATGGPNGSGSNTAGVTVITTTLYRTNDNPGQATPSVDSVVASFTVTFPQPAATGSVPGSASTGAAVDPASGELFTYTLTAPAATGPAVTNAPSGPGNGVSFTDFTTTLYRTRPDSGQGTPVVDTVVTCFTVTFPPTTGTGPFTGIPAASTVVPGNPDGGSVGTTTRYVPTMVPGPDGSLSYSIQTVVSTSTAPAPGSPSTAGSGVTTVYIPANPAGVTTVVALSDSAGIPTRGPSNVVTTTLYVPQPSAGTGVQPTDPSGLGSVVVFTLTVPQPPANGAVTYTTILPSIPGDNGSAGPSSVSVSTATIILTVPTPPAAPGDTIPSTIPGGYGEPALPGASGLPSGVPGSSNPSAGVPDSGTPGSGTPGSGNPGSGGGSSPGQTSVISPVGSGASQGTLGVPVTVTIPASGVNPTDTNGLPGGYTNPAQSGIPPFVLPGPQITVTVAQGAPDGGNPTSVAGVPTSAIGSYSVIVDPATVATGPQNSPSVITLWPVASSIASALPGAATSTSCTSSESTGVASTTVLTSSFINVVADETTTYTFPYESLVTKVDTISASATNVAITGGAVTGGAGGSAVVSTIIGVSTILGISTIAGVSTIGGPAVTASTASAPAVTASPAVTPSVSTWQSVVVQSSVVQVFTTGVFTSIVQPGGLQRRYINTTATSSTPTLTPVATPICTGTTDVGNLVLDFDDVSPGPLFNPYHRFWFSKGFLAGPPPLMPFLPSSGGRLVEFVPPVLSNTSSDGVSGDTAQIGMGKLASSPCFQFDYFGMNLGCHSTSDIPNQLCVFTFTGYRWDASNATETEAVSQQAWVNACNQSSGCPLTPFSAVDFTDLSSILITLQVDSRPQVWWSDDIRVGWSKNDCATANCRRQFQPEISQLHSGPSFYWTSSGLRVLSSSRINRG
ncbi:hypothetical protein CORC01_06128 [Colletotrichum orchidophilum]|uniref:DUF7371 domain-containing protein n=1 Tax=Colletotrichum orchidophilum TaxID=1209926 RepID=A0A1G4BAS8_9PEZI|nr:uncharacterized protein CORC01_06128 [Colletotrichum orchidophilum]OHE98507.1 hypothetical protein CORC01_06128 [Colletotrichum orchidophilum]